MSTRVENAATSPPAVPATATGLALGGAAPSADRTHAPGPASVLSSESRKILEVPPWATISVGRPSGATTAATGEDGPSGSSRTFARRTPAQPAPGPGSNQLVSTRSY